MTLKETLIAVLIAVIPLIILYFVDQSSKDHSLDKRIAIIEEIVPTRLELKEAVTEGVKEGLSEIITSQSEIKKDLLDCKLRIRTLEVQANLHK